MGDITKQALKQLGKIASLSSNRYGTLTQPEADAVLSQIENLRGRVRDLEFDHKDYQRGIDDERRRTSDRTNLFDAEVARLRANLDRKIVECGVLEGRAEVLKAVVDAARDGIRTRPQQEWIAADIDMEAALDALESDT